VEAWGVGGPSEGSGPILYIPSKKKCYPPACPHVDVASMVNRILPIACDRWFIAQTLLETDLLMLPWLISLSMNVGQELKVVTRNRLNSCLLINF